MVPEVRVPTVVMLEVPAHVDRAVFSTLPNPKLPLVIALVATAVTIPSVIVKSLKTLAPDSGE